MIPTTSHPARSTPSLMDWQRKRCRLPRESYFNVEPTEMILSFVRIQDNPSTLRLLTFTIPYESQVRIYSTSLSNELKTKGASKSSCADESRGRNTKRILRPQCQTPSTTLSWRRHKIPRRKNMETRNSYQRGRKRVIHSQEHRGSSLPEKQTAPAADKWKIWARYPRCKHC